MKIDWNKRYNTIFVYSLLFFATCYVIYKVFDNWDSTVTLSLKILDTLAPIILGIFIAYFLNPLVQFIEKIVVHKIKKKKLLRGVSITLTYIVVWGLIYLLLSFIIPELMQSVEDISSLTNDIILRITELAQADKPLEILNIEIDLGIVGKYINANIEETIASITSTIQSFAPQVLSIVTNLASGVVNVILGFIIAIYILINKEAAMRNARKVIYAILPSKRAIDLLNLAKESDKIFINFILGKLIDSFIVGVICYIVLLIMNSIFGMPYALLLSVIVAITNIIPYFGPFIGGAIGFVLLIFINPFSALIFLIWIVVLQQLDGNIIGPKILGDSTGLSPFWVIFAILVFGQLFGVIGMFIGVPVFAVIRNIFSRRIDALYENKISSM